jgi:hypothetical protein
MVGARIEHAIITNSEELLNFCMFDEDLNGNNGEEYTQEEALASGFENSAEYIVDISKKETDSFEGMIKKALELVCDTDQDYVAHEVIDIGGGRFVCIIAVAKNI